MICNTCRDSLREFDLYCWEENRDAPKKENDHAMDDIRYFAVTVARAREPSFSAGYVERTKF